MNTLLMTGTDTEVGKTILTSALAAYWQTFCASQTLGLMKLIQAGPGDEEHYRQLFADTSTIEICVPLRFQTPAAPPIAAEREGRSLELAHVWQALRSLQQRCDFTLVEALGGLGSPVTDELTVADLARDWRLPAVLVVPVRLGAIAQTVANVSLARTHGINLKGIILNCSQPISLEQQPLWAPIDLIQSLTQTPVLGIFPYLASPLTVPTFARAIADISLEALLPTSTYPLIGP